MLTVESTSTATIVLKMKGVEDQYVKDDGITFQDVVTTLDNQEDEFGTLVASVSANVTELEDEGRGGQEVGGGT